MNTTRVRVLQCISELACDFPVDCFHDLQRLEQELGLDSLDHIELHFNLENEFEIVIEDAEFEGVTTVGQAVALVEQKLAALPSHNPV